MRRVVVTGMGIVSCLGNSLDAVEATLRASRPGIRYVPEYAGLGLRSQVAGIPDVSSEPTIPRKHRRFMADAAQYAWWAMRQAVEDARLSGKDLTDPRLGLIVGSGVGSPYRHHEAVELLRTRGFEKVPPYAVPQVMGNTVSACLAIAFGIRGASYGLVSACATAAHCIGHGAELIRWGQQDAVVVGGAEEVCWTSTALFDAMGALSTGFNDRPGAASRPYDAGRDGFVIAGGAGILVLEELDRARARGAHIYGELTGYGACSDGADMVLPDADGAARAMRLALGEQPRRVDYINTHATSTRVGDLTELVAIRRVFGDEMPRLSSTKGLTGHPIAAAAAHEAIYCLLMLDRGFVAPCANIERIDPEAAAYPLVTALEDRPPEAVLSNSFGFGGTNASLYFSKLS